MTMRHLTLAVSLVTGACAEAPPLNSANPPGITRDVGSPSEVATRPGTGDGYRIVACPSRSSVIGVIGTGSFPVPNEYPVRYNVSQGLSAAFGPAALGVTAGWSCEKEKNGTRVALRVLVLSYRDVDEAARRTAAFLRENDLDVHCTVDIAPDKFLQDERWRTGPMSRDVGTMADVHTQPGAYDGYIVERCTYSGLLGLEGTGHKPLPEGNQALMTLEARIQTLMKPVVVGVGFSGAGCRGDEPGFAMDVMRLDEIDAAIARAGALLREEDLAVKMTVSLVGEAQDMGSRAR